MPQIYKSHKSHCKFVWLYLFSKHVFTRPSERVRVCVWCFSINFFVILIHSPFPLIWSLCFHLHPQYPDLHEELSIGRACPMHVSLCAGTKLFSNHDLSLTKTQTWINVRGWTNNLPARTYTARHWSQVLYEVQAALPPETSWKGLHCQTLISGFAQSSRSSSTRKSWISSKLSIRKRA
jgi:hypothetical protein